MQNHQQKSRLPQEPQREEVTPEQDSHSVNDPRIFSPTNILRLQRTIGNQAVLRLSQSGQTPRVQPTRLQTPHVQRDPLDAAKDLGNVYEHKVEVKEDQFSASGTFTVSRQNTSPFKAKTEDGLTGQMGEMKVSNTTSFEKDEKATGKVARRTAQSLAFALAKGSYDIGQLPFLPGITFKYDLKALETKLTLENLDVKSLEVDLLKISGYAEGVLSEMIQGTALGDELLATPLGDLIRSGAVIKITLKGEFKVHPSDVKRVISMLRASDEIVRNAEAAAKLARQHQALIRQNTDIGRRLASTTDKAEKARLNSQFATNRAKMVRLGRELAENTKNTQALRGVYKTAAEGLTSRAGRVIAIKVASTAARILTKALPVAGWLLAVYDVGSLLYEVYKGAQSDFESGSAGGDGAEGSATGGGDSTEDSTTESDTAASDVSQGATSNGGTSDTGGTLPGIHDLGDNVGGLSEPNAALPNVTEAGDDVSSVSEPGGLLPGVTDLEDDVSGGVSEPNGSLPGVTDLEDDVSSGTNAGGGSMPKGEAKDKIDVEEIVAGIHHHKGIIDASDQSYYLALPAECKKGDTFHRWFFWYGSAQVHATYTKVTILKHKEDNLTLKLAPSSVYLEDGTFLPNEFEGDTMKTRLLKTED